jgi:GH25 family lysozyme M1 (1,4-beta-N-acetylmuramidase)
MPRKRRRWPVVVAAFAACIVVIGAIAWHYAGDDDEPVEPPDCQTGPTTPGIDVSYHQDTIQWQRVRKAGVLFAFVRVSDGTTFPDPMFAKNWEGAGKVGIMRGAYQYFRPEESAIAQADLLIESLRGNPGELPPVIDVESTGGKSPKAIAKAVGVWVERVRSKLGVEPIIYTGPDFWRVHVGGADHSSQPLWLAHYTTSCPTVPAPWRAWTFWQYTERGQVPGITGPVDLDVFAGTFADLEEFARRSRRDVRSARRLERACERGSVQPSVSRGDQEGGCSRTASAVRASGSK